MKVFEEIKSLVEPITAKHDVFIVDIEIRGERGSKVLEIYIDNIKGITAEICSDVSRDISNVLDKAEILKGKYYLNVSSPGLTRPLKFLKQYYKHIGHTIAVRIKDKESVKELTAELIEVKEKSIVLKAKDIQEINFENIIETTVKTPW